MTDDPMLVSERWLTQADQTLRDLTSPEIGKRSHGAFYAIRPCRQASEWSGTSNAYYATAHPLKEGTSEPISNVTFKVYWRLSGAKPETTTGQLFWAVLRGGRWEYMVGDSGVRLTNAIFPFYSGTRVNVLSSITSWHVSVPRFKTSEVQILDDFEIDVRDASTGESIGSNYLSYYDYSSASHKNAALHVTQHYKTILAVTEVGYETISADVTTTTTPVVTSITTGDFVAAKIK